MTSSTDRSTALTDDTPHSEALEPAQPGLAESGLESGLDESSRGESSSNEDQDALAQRLSQLSADQWRQLGLSQRYHQHILTVFCEFTARGSVELSTQRLIESALERLEGPERTLFELTARSQVDQLTLHSWLSEDRSALTLDPQRARELERVVSLDASGEVVVELDVTSLRKNTLTPERAGQGAERAEITATTPPSEAIATKPHYIDPLEHISYQSESPFTIRRLNQLINSLDGGVLSATQVSALLQLEPAESALIFDATQRLGLIREDGGYLKLDFLGGRIARQPREDRLKTLAHMASRLRQEFKQRAND